MDHGLTLLTAVLIVTEPLPAATLDRLLPRRRMAGDTKNLVNYFRTTPDNRLLFGGRARFAVSNPASDEKSGAILQAALHGTIMAEVMDERTELNPRKDFDWRAIPGHAGPPWFLPLVGANYRLKDKLA